MRRFNGLSRRRAVVATLLVLASAGAFPAPVITETFHMLDNRGANSVGIGTGSRQYFGAVSIAPDPGRGIASAIAIQGPVVAPLLAQPFSVAPNFFSTSRSVSGATSGSWLITATDTQGGVSQAFTPDLSGASLMPLVETVRVGGSGAAPSFSWTLPSGIAPDAIRINIYDRDAPRVAGVADNVFAQNFGAGTTSFTINPGSPGLVGTGLALGRNYTLEIGLLDLRNSGDLTTINGNTLSRSRAFFDFTLDPNALNANAYLPSVCGGLTQSYCFRTDPFAVGQTIFIDPEVAIGYDYFIGAGDPSFQSVLLPVGIGDGLYDVWVWDATLNGFVLFSTSVPGGAALEFGPGGVEGFRVLGIEPSAGLDPNDGTAFVTGLTFATAGTFTGTMTPIVVSVPEPGILALIAFGGAGVMLSRRRRLKVI